MQIFRIIISTYPQALALFVIDGFIRIRPRLLRKVNLGFFILSILYVFCFFGGVFSDSTLIGIVSESKTYVFLLLLGLSSKGRKKISLKDLNKYAKSFVIFGLFLLLLSVLFTGRFLRFVDFAPFFSHYLTIYFGVSVALVIPFLKSRRWIMIGSLLILLNASGTGIIALIVVLSSLYLKRPFSFSTILVFILTLIISISFLFIGQSQRGRSIEGFEQIDRVILSIAAIKTIFDSSAKEILIGRPLSSSLPIDDYIEYEPVKEYILAENDGKIYPRNVHNEHLRLVLQFGVIGYFLIWSLLYRFYKERTVIFWILFFAGFTNMILSITPIIFICILISRSHLLSLKSITYE